MRLKPPAPGVDPRNDPDHATRILCGACGWELARAVDVSSHPELTGSEPARWPMLPLGANGWRPPPDPRGQDWEIWSPTGSLRNRTLRAARDLQAGRIGREAAFRQARPRLPASTRKRLELAGLPIHHKLWIPCGIVCAACGQLNWIRSWSPTTGLTLTA